MIQSKTVNLNKASWVSTFFKFALSLQNNKKFCSSAVDHVKTTGGNPKKRKRGVILTTFPCQLPAVRLGASENFAAKKLKHAYYALAS